LADLLPGNREGQNGELIIVLFRLLVAVTKYLTYINNLREERFIWPHTFSVHHSRESMVKQSSSEHDGQEVEKKNAYDN
jgi:hypothetical protein